MWSCPEYIIVLFASDHGRECCKLTPALQTSWFIDPASPLEETVQLKSIKGSPGIQRIGKQNFTYLKHSPWSLNGVTKDG